MANPLSPSRCNGIAAAAAFFPNTGFYLENVIWQFN
jgi:hypothetical protein